MSKNSISAFAIFSIAILLLLYACTQGQQANNHNALHAPQSSSENKSGSTVAARFMAPSGYSRIPAPQNSFAFFLQNLPLKPAGSAVHYFDGRIKSNLVHAAVLDVSVGTKDLQQCADALMRLRAEYLFSQEDYDAISFTLTNGFPVSFSKWRSGERVSVQGNSCSWVQTAAPSSTHETLLKYLEFVYSYAGTLSLSKTLTSVAIQNIQAGDVFVQGGSPGHAIIVLDEARDENGNACFLLAQSYMPAQDIHILINENNPAQSPWYSLPADGLLHTPEWDFSLSNLKRW